MIISDIFAGFNWVAHCTEASISSIVKLLYGQKTVDVVDIVDTSTSNDILEGWGGFSDYIFSKLDGVKNV